MAEHRFDDQTEREWEIINPSDAYTIVGTERVVAAILLFVGGGQLGFKATGSDQDDAMGFGSLCMFVGREEQKSIVDTVLDGSIDEFVARFGDQVIRACRSVQIGDSADRQVIRPSLDALEDPAAWRAEWERVHDLQRSSMNDIGRAVLRFSAQIQRMMVTASDRQVKP